ncbi:MAG: DNA internalization-related competence protein ComEC/Rec2 [Chloroflexota bacterium]|nr:DNA internalization-related competence protein ComEC/Rec2 [Chloroflexota bacterium]
MALVYLSIALVLGIYFGSQVPIPFDTALLAISIALFPAILLLVLRARRKPRHSGAIILGFICIALFIGGGLRFGTVPDGDDLQKYIGEENVTATGVIVEEPEATNTSVKLILSINEIDGEEASGILLVRTARYPSLEYGDLLSITGDLELPADDLDGFDYRAFLKRQGIYTTMYYPHVELVSKGQGPQPWQALYSFRHRLGEALSQSLPEPQGSMARAIILGLRHDIPPSLYEDFQRSGTAHLLAISGLHMSIIAGIILSVCVRLFGRHRPTYFIVTLGILWIYAILAGMSPSVMRAAMMISLYLLGAHLGRQRSGLPAVTFAAAVMVAIDPKILWEIGFQLSFGAVLGLILLAPAFQELLSRTRAPRLLADSFAYSLGAIVATLPLVAYYFGYVSLVSLLATFLATLALPAIIVVTVIVAFIGLFSPPAARIIGWIDWLLLKYTISVVQGFAAVPYASIELSKVKPWLVWLYYALLAAAMWVGSKIKRRLPGRNDDIAVLFDAPSLSSPAKWSVAILSIIAMLIWAAVFTAPDTGKLQVSVLDIGQGDAILVKSPSNQYILIDGGSAPELACLRLGETLPFWKHSIDMVVLTHGHDDHVGGLVEVLRRYDVEQILYSALYPVEETIRGEFDGKVAPPYEEFCEVIAGKGLEYTEARVGQTIDLGDGATIEVLNPPSDLVEGTDSDIDNNSVVLRVAMGEISFLLTGDLYWDGELYLVCERSTLDSTVLKVCHHGSKSSSRQYFLDAVSPYAAAISVGADNRFGHPGEEVVERLTDCVGDGLVFQTSERGTITFTTDGRRLWVETER